jgi:hypothetical protein
MVGNSEYGVRIYSEVADVAASIDNLISGCYFEDNVKLDVYLYDESSDSSLVKNTTVSDCKVKRTVDPTLGSSFSLSGTGNRIKGCKIRKTGAFGVFTAYNLFKGVDSTVSGCEAENLSNFGSYSSATRCVIEYCKGIDVAVAVSASTGGGGNITRFNEFYHGGAGTSDVAIPNYLFTGTEPERYEGNLFDGFHTGIAINEEAVSIVGNKSINSTLGGLRNYGDSFVGQELLNNSWDLTSPALISGLQKDNSPLSRAVVYNSAAPTTLSWVVGDRCFNTVPVVGQPKSWVCTVAGTAGTWVSEGNL